MRVSYFFRAIVAVAILSVGSLATLAQNAPLRGNVKLTGTDGRTAPVAGANIDVYRTDVKAEYHTKSDKNGEWAFAGIPLPGTYLVTVVTPRPGGGTSEPVEFMITFK